MMTTNELKRRYESGTGLIGLAALDGRPMSKVRRLLLMAGVKMRRRGMPSELYRGERHPRAKITNADRALIVARCRAGEKYASIGADLGLSHQRVQQIAAAYGVPARYSERRARS